MWLYVCSVQYVVSLLFAAICYFIYSYVAVCMLCAVRCVIIICCCLLFYLQLCGCMYVLCSTLCHYYLLLFVILFTVMWLYVCSVQYVVSLLFASFCYFLFTGLTIFNILFIFDFCFVFLLSSGPGSVAGIGLPTGWTVRGSNPGGGEIFRTCPYRS